MTRCAWRKDVGPRSEEVGLVLFALRCNGGFDQIAGMTQRFASSLPDEFDQILAVEKIGHGWCEAGDIEYFPAANSNDARSRAVFRLTPHAANEQGAVDIVRQIAGI
ncbi:hypothetical protein [Paraburkholderia kirstenboschensis]|uniref:Uncharacterized protein n=1 Tax=Paraburkholderia kirstenboschensis TaxID=1245436 RepID=A0ABZ0EG46_9BURK|nr:hypothetical protein [Paraburkholderia kirstenboschensis]WOD15900.1 hypothetical protein RW095_21975 [Paraburkholderia kirstenboschensis]